MWSERRICTLPLKSEYTLSMRRLVCSTCWGVKSVKGEVALAFLPQEMASLSMPYSLQPKPHCTSAIWGARFIVSAIANAVAAGVYQSNWNSADLVGQIHHGEAKAVRLRRKKCVWGWGSGGRGST